MKAKQDLYGVFDIDILEVSLKITQYLLTDLRTLKKINACLKIDPSLPRFSDIFEILLAFQICMPFSGITL